MRFKHPKNKFERRLVNQQKSRNKGGSKMQNQVLQTTISKELLAQLIEPFLYATSTLPDNTRVSSIHIEGLVKDQIPISIVFEQEVSKTTTPEGGDPNSPD